MSWSNEYIGIPYELHGREMDALDCWGLVRQVYKRELGFELPSYSANYEHTLDGDGFKISLETEMPSWQKVDRPIEFDVAWCRIAGVECHCGVILESGRMLHSMLGNDSCIVKIDNPSWDRRVQQCYRLL
jgi:cell wall-associated NlpC family hydrolase